MTLSPGKGKLSKGPPHCAHARSGSLGHLQYLGFQGPKPLRAAPPGPSEPRPRALADEDPRSHALPSQVPSQARSGRVRAPGSPAARSPFQSDGRAGTGAVRPFELAGVGAAESRPGRARDPARSVRRARAAVGGTGRSAGPPSAGSLGRKSYCPEPLRPRAGLGRGTQRPEWGERGARPAGAESAAAGRLSPAPPGATWTFRVRPSQEAVERGEGRRSGCELFRIKRPTSCLPAGWLWAHS